MPIRTILVPTDFSESAASALAWAQMLAKAFGAEIALLHVVDLEVVWMPVGGPVAIPLTIPTGVTEEITKQARAALDALERGAPEISHRLLRKGHAREVIISVAGEVDAETIVMGTHGRRGFSHLFIGSVAEYVVRQAPVPVWTVRARGPEDQPPSARR